MSEESAPERPWMIYGAYGYTGRLLAQDAVDAGERPVLAGRDPDKVRALAERLDLPWRAFGLDAPRKLASHLADIDLVAHCAGPFSVTAEPMREACLDAGSHYLDITGEIETLITTRALGEAAQSAGIVMMSGTGFDVVPTDCLAVALARGLPSARRLELAFHGDGGISPGTMKTMLEGAPGGLLVRRDGRLTGLPQGSLTRTVTFPVKGERFVMAIPWGDVATAYESTGIPDITVYTTSTPGAARALRWLGGLGRLLDLPPVRALGRRWIEANVDGPSAQRRQRARSYLWGRVEDDEGRSLEGTLVTPEGYRLTSLTTLEIARRVRAGEVRPGSWTPAEALGPDLILAFPDVERHLGDVPSLP